MQSHTSTSLRPRSLRQSFAVSYEYPVVFSRRLFEPSNDVLRQTLLRAGQKRHRVFVAIDSEVLAKTPDLPANIELYACQHSDLMELVGDPLVVRGGEICKMDPIELEVFYSEVERHQICRHSFVIAIGGGSVLDAVGYAAATAHRGIRLIRMPTTVLAQNDAGIGVKNAINFHGRKNFVGTFAPPFAVLNDAVFLDTLSPRDLRSGLAEAIKVALIRDGDFLLAMNEQRDRLAMFESQAMEESIFRCAELHLNHIGTSGDPFELGTARPLDFGHWSAHKLEQLDRDLRHGEAVAVGIALDAIYSEQSGYLSRTDLELILGLLQDLGFVLHHPALAKLDVGQALQDFREHIGGELTITLLQGIGRGFEVQHIDVPRMKASVEILKSLSTNPKEVSHA